MNIEKNCKAGSPHNPFLNVNLPDVLKHSKKEFSVLFAKIKKLLKAKDAVLVAHYYTDRELQIVAEKTGGYVSDSLDMARFGYNHSAKTLVVAGVKFMGETAKILNPEKHVLMPDLDATCSLDIGCPIEKFSQFCDSNPDRTVVVYANTSAEVKARADWVVTSSNAVRVVMHLMENGEKILWAPDKHLGHYIQGQTGADMKIWQGACIVHEAFKATELAKMKLHYPDAAVLVHPESPQDVIDLADAVGSTTQIIEASKKMPNKTFIVATDNGLFHKLKQNSPDKQFLEAPTAGQGAMCQSCAHCPWMAMNNLENLIHVLETGENSIEINESIRQRAFRSTQRMIEFGRAYAKAS